MDQMKGRSSYKRVRTLLFVIALILFNVYATRASHEGSPVGGLSETYYEDTCYNVSVIVQDVVVDHMIKDPTIAASLLRLQFHDCFLRGCDASILLSSTESNKAEKDAGGSRGLRGFDVIDDAKTKLEEACPGIVSCADILALVTRYAIGMLGGPMWDVRMGRRDGVVSLQSEVSANIPGPSSNFTRLHTLFQSKGLDVKDLVVLTGAHTIGIGHCGSISNRLYNFSGKGDTDPSLDAGYAAQLKGICKPGDRTSTVAMDPGSHMTFDNHYFQNLKKNKGLFFSDAVLLTDAAASLIVNIESRGRLFLQDHFAKSMKKMVELDFLTGTNGEVRRQCAFVNTS